MDTSFIRTSIIDSMRQRRQNLEEARAEMVRGLRSIGVSNAVQVVDAAVEEIQQRAQDFRRIEQVPAVVAPQYREAVSQDLKEGAWYLGPQKGDRYWPPLKTRLLSTGMAKAVPDIDQASSKVVGHFAQPGVKGLKKKGLVLGYVQSGKTANYTAVMAKAADAGYRTFIVLSGMHNNLRRQTQARVDKDLHTKEWASLTNLDADFGSVIDGAALMSHGVHSIAVVKKNGARLRRLRDWLRAIDPDVLARSPILILDDEADQATPNSLAAQEAYSSINRLIREIWATVPNGTYIGYTATPFANVFMDPDDEEELYPSDFILDLPRSEDYFGAERLFGRVALDDADEPDDGLDMIRSIPVEEATTLVPPSNAVERSSHDPELPASLVSAVRWFVLASAVRRFRGQVGAHSSMLVHTSSYIAPHFTIGGRLTELLEELANDFPDDKAWEALYQDEAARVRGLNSEPRPSWPEFKYLVPAVLDDVRVVIDNGNSEDRLDYDRVNADGEPMAEVVIAVGGNTLSRGLTLEGLTVSYFVRTASTYDTLLQMGRWFGYRAGYEDLPRVWVTDDLMEDFRFLALVEEEMRRDMRRLESMNVTPQQFGLRVRAHPGRLAITSRSKMTHADLVRVSYSGQRHQTIVLHEADTEALEHNLRLTRSLVSECIATSPPGGLREPRQSQFFDLPSTTVVDFLTQYRFHPDQPGLRSEHIAGWLRSSASDINWNVAVLGTSRVLRDRSGEVVDLGSVDLGLPYEIPMVNRAPLSKPSSGAANIKALLSQQDWLADIDPDLVSELRPRGQDEYRAARSEFGDGNGLMIVYVVSPRSVPVRETQKGARRPMTATAPIVGLGLIFPDTDGAEFAQEGSYYSVRPDWSVAMDDVEDIPTDREGFATVTAAHLVGMDDGY